MLVLARRQGESIVIGGEVVVTVLEVRGGQVRIGIEAPKHVKVHREEVYREVQEANREAVASLHPQTDQDLRTTVDKLRQADTSHKEA